MLQRGHYDFFLSMGNWFLSSGMSLVRKCVPLLVPMLGVCCTQRLLGVPIKQCSLSLFPLLSSTGLPLGFHFTSTESLTSV